MGLETPRQRIAVLAIVLAFVAVVLLTMAWAFVSLSDANQTTLGHWIDEHSAAIWGFIPGAVAAVATYLFGRRAGRRSGKTEAYNSAIATVREKTSFTDAADALRAEAEGHGLNVTA